MANAKTFLSESDRRRIVEAIETAEKQTSAEIVCAVSTESGRYDRAESLGALAGALLGLSAVHLLVNLGGGEGDWNPMESAALLWQGVGVIVGYFVGLVIFSYCHPLRYILTSEREMAVETERSADRVFAMQGLHKTEGKGGFLLYVSLYERRMAIRADERALEAADEARLTEWCDMAGKALRDNRRSEAFLEVISEATKVFSEKLPRNADDRDELPNHFLVFHPRP